VVVLRHERDQIIRFLRALDAALEGDVKIFVVGGLAAILQYDAAVKTADMDVYGLVSGSQSDLLQAARVASEVTGIVLPIGHASVTELPDDYEDRLKTVRGLRLKKLTMIVPDKYDLALSKTVRGYEHDLEAIASMHEQHRLSENTLIRRFENELRKTAMGDPRNLTINMFRLIRLLYGEKHAAIYWKRWGLDKPR
jgi:hypothetical protein